MSSLTETGDVAQEYSDCHPSVRTTVQIPSTQLYKCQVGGSLSTIPTSGR